MYMLKNVFLIFNISNNKVVQKNCFNKQNIILFFKILLFYFLISLAISGLLAVFWLIIHNIFIEINLTSKVHPEKMLNQYGKYAFLIVAFVAPILEESIFRLPLIFNKRNISICLLAIAVMLCYKNIDNILYLSIILSSVCIALCLLFFAVKEVYIRVIREKYTIYIIYISIICFTLIHITNYNIASIVYLPIYCILLLPIFSLAVFTSYVRLNLGFVYSILFHIINNIIPLLYFFITHAS